MVAGTRIFERSESNDFMRVEGDRDRPDANDTAIVRQRIASLTGVRGVAALWVVAYHIQIISTTYGYSIIGTHSLLITAGWSAVDLFFMLSGFMLMYSHADLFAVIDKTSLQRFALARFTRIYPVSSVVLVVIACYMFVDTAFADHYRVLAQGNLSAKAFVATALLATRWLPVQGDWNQPVWSLSAEIMGYVVFPLIATRVRTIKSPTLALGLAGVIIAATMNVQIVLGYFGKNDILQQASMIRVLGYFPAGIFVFQGAWLLKDRGLERWAKVTGPLSLGFIIVLTNLPRGGGGIPMFYAALLFSLMFQTGLINAALASRPMVFLGEISFPLYVIHIIPVLALTYHCAHADVSNDSYELGVVALLAVVILLSWMMHIWVEKPAHGLSRRLQR